MALVRTAPARTRTDEWAALSAKSVLGVRAVLHQILDDAVRRGGAESHAATASPLRHETPVVTVWSADEVRTFLSTARSHRLFPAFEVPLAAGLTRVASWSDCGGATSTST